MLVILGSSDGGVVFATCKLVLVWFVTTAGHVRSCYGCCSVTVLGKPETMGKATGLLTPPSLSYFIFIFSS